MADEATETTTDPVGSSALQIDLPEDPAAAVQMLLDLLVESREESAARLDDLQRVAAEFENFRKRAERDREEIRQRASQRLVEALLPVLDSFDGAFAHDAQSPGEESLKSGITGTFGQLTEILQREGLAVIESAGQPFDPERHEAVAGGGGDELIVATELRRGYTLRGRVIRPAMVAVAPAGTGEQDQE